MVITSDLIGKAKNSKRLEFKGLIWCAAGLRRWALRKWACWLTGLVGFPVHVWCNVWFQAAWPGHSPPLTLRPTVFLVQLFAQMPCALAYTAHGKQIAGDIMETRNVDAMLFSCWNSVCAAGPTWEQHWLSLVLADMLMCASEQAASAVCLFSVHVYKCNWRTKTHKHREKHDNDRLSLSIKHGETR